MGTTAFRTNNALGTPPMSRAFVKKSDDETVLLPDRPISSHRNFEALRADLLEFRFGKGKDNSAFSPPIVQTLPCVISFRR
jgi:hypothetical protein